MQSPGFQNYMSEVPCTMVSGLNSDIAPDNSMSEKMRSFVYEDRNGWRRWLRVNHAEQPEVWLVLPKKSAEATRTESSTTKLSRRLCASVGLTAESSPLMQQEAWSASHQEEQKLVSLQSRQSPGIDKEGEDDQGRAQVPSQRLCFRSREVGRNLRSP